MSGAALFVVMGVSGSGKSTVGRLLAEATGGEFLDGDDFHTPEHKAKMHSGVPLTDEDRAPWLDRLNAELRARSGAGKPVFLACSALKQSHRDRLAAGLPWLRFVYMKGSFEVLSARLAARKGHFMPATLLRSQLETLEEPRDAIVLEIEQTPEAMVAGFRAALAEV
jgi:gluconokinase